MICKWPTLVKLGFSLLPKMAKNGQSHFPCFMCLKFVIVLKTNI